MTTNQDSKTILKGDHIHSDHEIQFRKPRTEDGSAMWELVRNTGALDLNSSYSYLMFCQFFSDTCVIAESKGKLVGFVLAFQPPEHPDTIFVWQIAVDKSQRGKGLGRSLLDTLLNQNASEQIRYLEATISPSNYPSQSLFRGLANDFDTHCEVSECFPATLFPESDHEEELSYRIGPIN